MSHRSIVMGVAIFVVCIISCSSHASSTTIQSNIVSPPMTLDGGADRLPYPSGDGINDSVGTPSSSSCPFPGIGFCAADPTIVCSMLPHAGIDLSSYECPLSSGFCSGPPATETCCIESEIGPDGITSGDNAGSIALGSGKSTLKIHVAHALDASHKLIATVQCQLKNVENSGSPVSTDGNAGDTGTCQSGPCDGCPCTINSDCKDRADPKAVYFCTTGDEYNCTIHGIAASNADDDPPCGGPCLAVLAAPSGCGTAQGGVCAIGTCAGGSIRDGQPCDVNGQTTCPGGFCDGVSSHLALTGDETGFFAPTLLGELYFACPVAFEIGYPIELNSGHGQVKVDLAQSPMRACIPAGNSTRFVGAEIHAPTGDPIHNSSNSARFGFYKGASATSANGSPCPAASLSLPESFTGQPTFIGIGPIIGVAGALTQ